MKDIGELEQDGGYPFNLNGNSKCFSGTIAFVFGGFKVGPGLHLKCRECMGQTEEIPTKV